MSSNPSDSDGRPTSKSDNNPNFHTTHWSLVLAAGAGTSSNRNNALASLCELYWYPLYAFVRRKGFEAHDAQDSVQAFFVFLLEKDLVNVADQQRGKFRTFLLTAFSNFLKNQIASKNAAKRGGGKQFLSFDFIAGEHKFSAEPSTQESPENFYLRQWAITLIDGVMEQLKENYEKAGKGCVFQALAPCLTPGASSQSYESIAEDLQLTVANVKTSVHRLRQRFREKLKAEIAQTVQEEWMIEEEIQELFQALSSAR